MPGVTAAEASSTEGPDKPPFVNFFSDGLYFSPAEYIQQLDAVHKAKPIKGDRYGNGGTTKELEEAFVKTYRQRKGDLLSLGNHGQPGRDQSTEWRQH